MVVLTIRLQRATIVLPTSGKEMKMKMKMKMISTLSLLSLLCLLSSISASQLPPNQQLIPPLSPVRNVTGALNTFMEQVQEMQPDPPVVIMGNRASQVAVPLQFPAIQPTPIQAQPQQPPVQQPIIDPALQRLLNSFNTVPVDYAHPQQVAYSVAPVVNGAPATVVSYVTCYVGCSHVTNVVSAASALKPSYLVAVFSVVVMLLI